MFRVQRRDELREHVVEMARRDPRVVAAAEVGSLAAGEGDRWSDVDLTFGVDDSSGVAAVLSDWTSTLVEAGGVELFDLVSGPTIYRVFMFEDCLQLDVSFTPASEFRPTSPRFRLIFGSAGEQRVAYPETARAFLGWAVMWASHARISIERGRWRQAEHAISRMRESALDAAARRRGLPAGYGRGVEQLPADVYERFSSSLVTAVDPEALKDALRACVAALSAECDATDEPGRRILERLSETVKGL